MSVPSPIAGGQMLVEGITTGKVKNRYATPAPQSNLNKAAQAILKAGERWHINPAYLWGIYGVETSYGSGISISSTGARGPFQFEPATAKQYGYPLGVNEHGITDWGAFSQQADAAAHYLAAHGGQHNPRKAVEAYNPGEKSYYGKVVEHAKSFFRSFGSEAENKAEANKVKEGEGGNGFFAELLAGLAKLAVTGVLLLAGAVLVVYGIMIAVRPRESALSIPIPV